MRGINVQSNVAAFVNADVLFAAKKKATKTKVIVFFGDTAAQDAADAAAQGLLQIVGAEAEKANADALNTAAKIDLNYIVQQFRDAKLTVEPSAKKQGSIARLIMTQLMEAEPSLRKPDGGPTQYCANLIGDFRHAVNVSGKFVRNHQRVGKGSDKAGNTPLIQKSDSAYSLNLKSNTPPAKALDALKQLGAWFKARAPKGADVSDPYLQIGAYLSEIDTEVKA